MKAVLPNFLSSSEKLHLIGVLSFHCAIFVLLFKDSKFFLVKTHLLLILVFKSFEVIHLENW